MLAPQHRITRGVDYRRVARARRIGGRYLIVHGDLREDASAPTRFGFIITKRVGVAVVRNRLRRQLKAICYELIPTLPAGVDFIIRVQPTATEIDFATLRQQCRKQVTALTDQLLPMRSEFCSCSDLDDDA